MGGPNTRDGVDFFRDLLERVGALEARRPRQVGRDFAALSGPASLASAYRNQWSASLVQGRSFEISSDVQGVVIVEDGQYDIEVYQRGNGTSGTGAWIALALSGDRAALEARESGFFTHDHSVGVNSFTRSRYMGFLAAEEVITAGPTVGNVGALAFGAGRTIGALYARRIS
jgi:hypothetical protein